MVVGANLCHQNLQGQATSKNRLVKRSARERKINLCSVGALRRFGPEARRYNGKINPEGNKSIWGKHPIAENTVADI